MGNKLIVVSDGNLREYNLDEKSEWKVGRITPQRMPDIPFNTATVSREHGEFRNVEGVWFYIDAYAKNGTMHNNKYVKRGIGNRVKPILLNDGDIFIFGGGQKPVLNSKSAWAMFYTQDVEGDWRVVDTEGIDKIKLEYNGIITEFSYPPKWTVFKSNNGYAVYIGNNMYLIGSINLI